MRSHALAEFLPVAADAGEVHLVRSGPPPFEHAFLSQTIAALDPSAPRIAIEADALRTLQPEPGPVGLIVHCSRCGSTLLCRLLEAAGPVATFREPDALVHTALADPRTAPALIAQYAWLARSAGRAPVIKLPSTGHVLLDHLQPPSSTAVVGVVRHPVPVVASLIADPPEWLVRRSAGAQDVERAVEIATDSWVDAAARIVGLAPRAQLVTYRELVQRPQATVARVLGATGVAADTRSSRFDATRDVDAKRGGRWSPVPTVPGIERTMRSTILERTAEMRSRLARLALDPDELTDDGDLR